MYISRSVETAEIPGFIRLWANAALLYVFAFQSVKSWEYTITSHCVQIGISHAWNVVQLPVMSVTDMREAVELDYHLHRCRGGYTY